MTYQRELLQTKLNSQLQVKHFAQENYFIVLEFFF